MILLNNFFGKSFKELCKERLSMINTKEAFYYLPDYDIPGKVVAVYFTLWCEQENLKEEDLTESEDIEDIIESNRDQYFSESRFYYTINKTTLMFKTPYRKVIKHLLSLFREMYGVFSIKKSFRAIESDIDDMRLEKASYKQDIVFDYTVI